MLRHLEINDILIIQHLELAFEPGLNVLTGETGAGKSILLDSLGFVLGWRGRADLVRQGAERGEVTAVFTLPPQHPARALLTEAGLPGEDEEELILRRTNGSDGRKAAWVNNRRCGGDVLRALSETLLELHGQHDDRGLLNTRTHRAILDSWADIAQPLAQLHTHWQTLHTALAKQQKAKSALEEAMAEESFLRHAVAELEAFNAQPGEDTHLDSARRRMQGAERVRADVGRALQAVSASGAEGAICDAMRWLDEAQETCEGALDAPQAALARALTELGDATQGIEECLNLLDFDPQSLEQTEERLFALRALARKHQVAPDDLPALYTELHTRLTQIDNSSNSQQALAEAVDQARAAYDAQAKKISAARHEAAKALDAAMSAELAPLKMERAVFTTTLSAQEAGPDGIDQVAFEVAPNPGAPAGPLGKIASGGELSRFLLALKVCLSARDGGGVTMIFDEIDRGVGGATAAAVGRRLADLAKQGQVLAVTHSPQVAAIADHHWQVSKTVSNGQTLSTVTPLTPNARIDEIARMLAGDTITPEARAAARALIE